MTRGNRWFGRMLSSDSHIGAKPRTMSRAFVKEVEQEIDDLPDRPVSVHPNLVTADVTHSGHRGGLMPTDLIGQPDGITRRSRSLQRDGGGVSRAVWAIRAVSLLKRRTVLWPLYRPCFSGGGVQCQLRAQATTVEWLARSPPSRRCCRSGFCPGRRSGRFADQNPRRQR